MTRIALLVLGICTMLSLPAMKAQTCVDDLFTIENSLTCNGGNPHPSIQSYHGSCVSNMNICPVPYTFQIASPNDFIVIGPTTGAVYVWFEYLTNNTQPVRIFVSNTPNGNWTELLPPPPLAVDQCSIFITPLIPSGMYYMIIQCTQCGGQGNGNIRIWNIFEDTNVPVQLTAFTGSWNGSEVRLAWRTATEVNNFGFEVQRSVIPGTWETVGFVSGHGTVNTPQSYAYRDVPPPGAGTVSYRLRQVDRDGSDDISAVVTVTTCKPVAFEIRQASPNPFSPASTLSYSVPEPARITLVVIDHAGREIARLVDNQLTDAGHYSRLFNAYGLPSGTYFAWLHSADKSSVLKMQIVR